MDVEVSDFVHGAARLPATNTVIYREEFLNVFYRSNVQGDLGEWPDPLIPKVDPEYGEIRNAFPYDLHRVSRAYRKYNQFGGRAGSAPHGLGEVLTGGNYTGVMSGHYVVRIVRSGSLGTAAFEWWREPGSGKAATSQVTSGSPVELDQNVTVAFHGAGRADDFLAGEEFWFYAGRERHQPVWVDVTIPADAVPGTYTAHVVVKRSGATPIRLPLQIEVLGFSIPSTSTLASFFGFYSPGAYSAHYGAVRDEQKALELAQAYSRAALRNSITLESPREFAPLYQFKPDGTVAKVDYTKFDRAVAAFLDGQGTPRGARWTALRLPKFAGLSEQQFKSAVKDFVRHARERGWHDLLFDYTYDEPHTPEQFAELRLRAQRVRDADAGIPRLVTTRLDESLVGTVTRWCPIVNSFEPSTATLREWWRNRNLPRRADYDARLKAGDSLWWYQSCMSHSCGGEGKAPQDVDWPSYMVDISAVANRVFGFLSAVTYEVSGVLYWETVYAHHHDAGKEARALDAWESVYYFGGNGDGSLFYPGRPEQIGGKHHIAIESLRLKMIRDSFYDAEYSYLLRRAGEDVFLRREVSRVVEDARHWNTDPQAWVALHHTLARRLATATLSQNPR